MDYTAPPNHPADPAEKGMTPDAILGLYNWTAGTCFRCGDDDFVTPLGAVDTPRGERYELDACGCCILRLEAERRRYALRQGIQYRPGTLGGTAQDGPASMS